MTEWKNGEPSAFSEYTGGSDSEMKGGSKLDWQYRSFNFMANVDWKRQFGEHKVYTTLMYTYKYDNNANIAIGHGIRIMGIKIVISSILH